LVNLLPRIESREAFPTLDPEQRARFESRLRRLASAVSSPDFLRRLERSLDGLEGPLDELESDASLVIALDLIEGIERARVEASMESDDRGARAEGEAGSPSRLPNGEFICYWPGRSLATGESDVASRGFFDGLDRPPLDRPPIGFWIEAIARPMDETRAKFEIAIIAWIPAEDVARATAGRRACTSGALAMLGEASESLAAQLDPIRVGSAAERST